MSITSQITFSEAEIVAEFKKVCPEMKERDLFFRYRDAIEVNGEDRYSISSMLMVFRDLLFVKTDRANELEAENDNTDLGAFVPLTEISKFCQEPWTGGANCTPSMVEDAAKDLEIDYLIDVDTGEKVVMYNHAGKLICGIKCMQSDIEGYPEWYEFHG